MNARDNIKPKSIRLAILAGLANGAITTIDDLQIRIGEPRKKVAQNVYPAAIDGLIRRMKDDITGGPAYQITDKGREYLAKYADGSNAEPDPEVATVKDSLTAQPETKKAEAVALETLESAMPGFTAEVVAQKDAEIASLIHDLKEAEARIDKLQNAVGAVIEYDDSVPHNAGWFVYGESSAHDTAELAMIAYAKNNEQRIKELEESLALARMARAVTPSGYVVQRPAKPLTRFTKIENAKARAMSFARSGVKAQVFALVAVGAAVPGSEWRE